MPVVVVPPGDLVRVQVPVTGNPFRTILPVAKVQVGCVMVPTVGAVGKGFTVTAKFADNVPVPQLLFPCTVILPLDAIVL